MAIYIGLDIGGTKLMVAAADASGAILRRTRAATPLGLDEGLDLLNRMIAQVAEGDEIVAIGAAIGGPLDAEQGIVSPLHQPQWRAVPLKRRQGLNRVSARCFARRPSGPGVPGFPLFGGIALPAAGPA